MAATDTGQREAAKNEVRASDIVMVCYEADAAECETAGYVVEADECEEKATDASGNDIKTGESDTTVTETAKCGHGMRPMQPSGR